MMSLRLSTVLLYIKSCDIYVAGVSLICPVQSCIKRIILLTQLSVYLSNNLDRIVSNDVMLATLGLLHAH